MFRVCQRVIDWDHSSLYKGRTVTLREKAGSVFIVDMPTGSGGVMSWALRTTNMRRPFMLAMVERFIRGQFEHVDEIDNWYDIEVWVAEEMRTMAEYMEHFEDPGIIATDLLINMPEEERQSLIDHLREVYAEEIQ